MVRTKADGGARKAVAAKAPRKALAPASRPSALMSPKAGGKRDKYGGGNAVNPQPTPEWQKSITRFFSNVPGSSSSSSAGKENADPEGPCSSKDVDRTKEEIAEESSSSSTSKPAPEEESEDEMEQEEEEEDEEEEEEKPAASSKSRKNTNFKRNKCVSDSDDDDD